MDETPELNRQNLGVLVDDIRSEAGPGEATKRYNQAFIQTFEKMAARCQTISTNTHGCC